MFICRLQEKILNVESENQILRQKSLLHTSGQLPPTPAKVYLRKIYFAFSGILIIKVVLSCLQNSQNGHFSSKESLINVSRVLIFFPFPLNYVPSLCMSLTTFVQGAEIETPARTQESDAKARSLQKERQHVCCSV